EAPGPAGARAGPRRLGADPSTPGPAVLGPAAPGVRAAGSAGGRPPSARAGGARRGRARPDGRPVRRVRSLGELPGRSARRPPRAGGGVVPRAGGPHDGPAQPHVARTRASLAGHGEPRDAAAGAGAGPRLPAYDAAQHGARHGGRAGRPDRRHLGRRPRSRPGRPRRTRPHLPARLGGAPRGPLRTGEPRDIPRCGGPHGPADPRSSTRRGRPGVPRRSRL
ncbi:MAG: hypothetical protein AVDCRST_MAG32-3041, partial [uncultured Nocardioides sp.]